MERIADYRSQGLWLKSLTRPNVMLPGIVTSSLCEGIMRRGELEGKDQDIDLQSQRLSVLRTTFGI